METSEHQEVRLLAQLADVFHAIKHIYINANPSTPHDDTYVLYTPDSSRYIVEAIFYRKCDFSIFLICHLKISNNLFWVVSKFILAENCIEFINTCGTQLSKAKAEVGCEALSSSLDAWIGNNMLQEDTPSALQAEEIPCKKKAVTQLLEASSKPGSEH